jgi:iron complex outermembrane receptor protein
MNRTRIAAILLGLALSGASQVGRAQQEAALTAEELEKIEVTGSAIRRTDAETASPVQVISSDDLKRSGYTDVSDVLRNISANGAGSLSQAFNFAFAGGGSGIALRGLAVGSTLVLIDGHRMAPYPLSDDAQRSFVDISDIPFDAVDHIEILKDGASALYGSDAMAGVVNIILKKSFVGISVGAEHGFSSHDDGKTNRVSGAIGGGDLAADGYNGFVSVEYRHQDNILVANRSGTWNASDPAAWQTLGAGPGSTNNITPGVPNGNNGGSPASIQSITGVLVNPGATGASYAFLPGCTQALQASGGCGFLNNGQEIQPATENINLLGRFTFNLGDGWQSSTALSLFDSRAEQTQLYGGLNNPQGTNYPGGITAFNAGPGRTPSPGPGIPAVITVPANYPGNPYGQAAPLIDSFADVGDAQQLFETMTYRLAEDLNGTFAGWDIHGAFGVSYANTAGTYTHSINIGNLQTALNDGSYHVGSLAYENSPAVYNFIAPTIYSNGSDLLDYVSVNGQRDIAQLPGGPLSLATGAEVTHRELDNLNAPAIAQGDVSGLIGYAVGHQTDYGAFVELQGALVRNLELDLAARIDHYATDYDNGGTAAVPKAQFKYTPIPLLTVRGTWGEGYRIPSPAEAGQSGAVFSAGTINDASLCPLNSSGQPAPIAGLGYWFPSQCAIAPPNFQQSVSNLKPERSTNKTFGIILEPSKRLNFSADYYDIKIRDQIVSGFELGGLEGLTNSPNTGELPVRTPIVSLQNNLGQTVKTPTGLLLYTLVPYANAGVTETSGIDFDLRTRWDLGEAGKLIGALSFTHVLKYNLTYNGTTWYLAGTQGPSGVSGDTGNPRNRGSLSFTWERQLFELTLNANYVGGWDINDPSAGQFTCDQGAAAQFSLAYLGGLFNGGAVNPSLCHVKNFVDYDLYASFHIDKAWSVHASILNLFNTPPPIDVSTYGGGGGGLYSTLDQAGAVGRFYNIGVSYRF